MLWCSCGLKVVCIIFLCFFICLWSVCFCCDFVSLVMIWVLSLSGMVFIWLVVVLLLLRFDL